ncbi:MAG TPA: PDZ domain-containing protein [Vicinamibacterales bacterium]|nr:PDZ domain-containing protein [Vicinamibacterales bacterium]
MRSRSNPSRSVIYAALLCFIAATASAQQPVEYRVSFPAPEHHYAQVEVTWPGITAATLEARMSRSSPGRYAVHEFAKNVFDVHAFDGKGREMKASRPNPSQWDVTGHDGTVRIVYKVFGNHVDGTYLAVDDSHAHMNMPATLMWARGFDMRPVRVTFQPPPRSSWKPATQLYPTSDPWTFTAPNLQYLMDSPAELSDYTLRSFTVRNPDGKEFTIRTAVHHDGDSSVIDEYVAGAERIVNEAAAVFGEFPAYDTGTYTFLGDYVPWGGGDGMEHRNSTVVASATSFKNPQAVRAVLGTLSHEFFHCWNVERIRPKTLEPFNFEEANISGELWLAEGFTQYYGPLIMTRAGLSAPDAAGLARNVVAVINSPARQFRSAVEMSQMAPFSDAAVSIDENNLGPTFISYYTYGAAIATALDLSLRDRSNGKTTLDDYMRAMWLAHGKPGGPSPAIIARPYTLKDARDRLAEVSGDREYADDFFDKYIEGRELPDFPKLLARVGLVLRKSNPGGAWVGLLDQSFAGGGRARRGRAPAMAGASGTGLRVQALVNWGTPAFRAGIEEGDEVTSADGRPIATIEDWQAAVRAHKPGDSMAVEFTRHGATLKATIPVAEDPTVELVTLESTGATLSADQKMMRDAWLRSKRRP